MKTVPEILAEIGRLERLHNANLQGRTDSILQILKQFILQPSAECGHIILQSAECGHESEWYAMSPVSGFYQCKKCGVQLTPK